MDVNALRVANGVIVPAQELRETFIRASGPGGQNVNKLATAVQLRFDAANSPSLPPQVRRRLLLLAGARATNEGEIIIEAKRYRSREQNRRDARQRLLGLLHRAAQRPKPRRPTRPTAGSVRRRLDSKKRSGHLKRQRRRVDDIDL